MKGYLLLIQNTAHGDVKAKASYRPPSLPMKNAFFHIFFSSTTLQSQETGAEETCGPPDSESGGRGF